jgi:hypothetical protein
MYFAGPAVVVINKYTQEKRRVRFRYTYPPYPRIGRGPTTRIYTSRPYTWLRARTAGPRYIWRSGASHGVGLTKEYRHNIIENTIDKLNCQYI